MHNKIENNKVKTKNMLKKIKLTNFQFVTADIIPLFIIILRAAIIKCVYQHVFKQYNLNCISFHVRTILVGSSNSSRD